MMTKNFRFSLCLLSCGAINAQNDLVQFQQVFDVISAPRIYASSSDKLLQRLSPLCAASERSGRELIKYGNVECREAVRAISFTISTDDDNRISMIDTSFEGAAKCEYMRKTLIMNFGKPTKANGECGLEWWLNTPKGKARRFIAMGSSLPRDKVYFSIGEEQGP